METCWISFWFFLTFLKEFVRVHLVLITIKCCFLNISNKKNLIVHLIWRKQFFFQFFSVSVSLCLKTMNVLRKDLNAIFSNFFQKSGHRVFGFVFKFIHRQMSRNN